jgi:hypothetical protein
MAQCHAIRKRLVATEKLRISHYISRMVLLFKVIRSTTHLVMMSVGEISQNHEIVISNSREIYVGNILCNDNISRALQFFGVHSLHGFVGKMRVFLNPLMKQIIFTICKHIKWSFSPIQWPQKKRGLASNSPKGLPRLA